MANRNSEPDTALFWPVYVTGSGVGKEHGQSERLSQQVSVGQLELPLRSISTLLPA
jgi:hypothetical protein